MIPELRRRSEEDWPQLHLGVQDLTELHEHCLKVNKQANEHQKQKLGVVNTHGRCPPRQPWETDIGCSFFSTSKEPLVGQAPCARSYGLPVTESGVKTRISGAVSREWYYLFVHRLTIKNEEILLVLPVVVKTFVFCGKGFLKKTKCQKFVTTVDDKHRIP